MSTIPDEDIAPEKVLRRMVAMAERRARSRRLPVWSIVGEWTGHGSGYSQRIVERYGTESRHEEKES